VHHRIAALIFLLTLSPGMRADNLVGRVVDPNGVGVPGIDIDVDNTGSGGRPDIFNDGTDALGFFNVTLPPGQYIVRFTPQPPPAQPLLIRELPERVYVGTVDVGTIVLSAGVALSGHVVNTSGLPVAGVRVNPLIADPNQVLRNATSDAFGAFAVVVPPGPATLQFDTTVVPLQSLAPRQMVDSYLTSQDFGNVVLQPGRHLTGRLLRPNGLPYADLDLDVFDADTGEMLFTPNDNTLVNGQFDILIGPGTYDLEICPPLAQRMVGRLFKDLTVGGTNLPLGDVQLQSGFLLSGTVRGPDGTLVAGVDLDVDDLLTGQRVHTCNDNTNASGAYTVIVPPGHLEVIYGFPDARPAEQVHQVIDVGGDLVRHVVLPSCPPCNGQEAVRPVAGGTTVEVSPYLEPVNYGAGTAGTAGFVPHLGHSGGLARIQGTWSLVLEGGLGGRPAMLTLGSREASLHALGGVLLVNPFVDAETFNLTLGGPLDVPGAGTAVFPLPPVPESFVGLEVFAQFGVLDPGAPGVLSMSEGLRFTLAP